MALHGNVLVPMVPSAFGFRNIRPKTRHERLGKNDKVALERERLAQRSGWQARLHQANAPPTTAGLTSCQPNDEGYMSNAERFHSDVSGEEFALRQEALRKREAATLFRRDKMRQREEVKWKGVEDADRAGEEYWTKVREDPTMQVRRGGKKNASNVAYDITNLQYNQDTSGEMQRYLDEMVKFRAQSRTRALVVLGDSRAPYNIISGDERTLPPKPTQLYARPQVGPEEARGLRVDPRRVDTPFKIDR